MPVEHFPVERGHIAMFARSISDPNPIYYDPECAAASEFGGTLAPPTFVRASVQFDPDYRLRPKFDEPWIGSGRDATGVSDAQDAGSGRGGAGLHAEQHFEYHRPMRAGDVLTAVPRDGEQWSKQGRRGGLLQFSETITEYFDAAGELVVVARSVTVQTGQVVEQEG